MLDDLETVFSHPPVTRCVSGKSTGRCFLRTGGENHKSSPLCCCLTSQRVFPLTAPACVAGDVPAVGAPDGGSLPETGFPSGQGKELGERTLF